jgi:transcriptional regulator with XRE-family HTH domain
MKQGMTVRELAQALGYASYSHISDIETGRRNPSLDFALRVSRLFGVTTDQLLKDEQDIEE